MTRRGRLWSLFVCGLLASCVARTRDPFVAAERAMHKDDLLSALQAYDTVPVSHPRYPDARAAAVEIERRMRRCHELILEALVLRGEWRDDEALESLQRARKQWARQPSIDRWIVATEQRRRLFGDGARQAAPSAPLGSEVGEVVEVAPSAVPPQTSAAVVAEPVAPIARTVSPVGAMPRDTVPSPVTSREPAGDGPVAAGPEEARGPAAGRGTAPPPVVVVGAAPIGEARPAQVREAPTPVARPAPRPSARVSVGEDPVALGLVSVEGCLGRGELRQAVDDLIELARRFPSDLRVCQRLVPLLKQRALLSYGDGAVAAAITDWRRVLEMQPDDPIVPTLIERALQESRGAVQGSEAPLQEARRAGESERR
ncbi:MAG: hypothetical protein H6835_04360 [Planctomycetes bacterium]|nr:hypothetical protein [Planctomycetota bacterium]